MTINRRTLLGPLVFYLWRNLQMTNENMTSDRSLLTNKELNYIKDFLSWELLAMKKCNDSASHCEDQAISNLIKQTGQQHLQHFETLLSHLNR